MEPLKFFNEYVGDLMCAEFRLPLQARYLVFFETIQPTAGLTSFSLESHPPISTSAPRLKVCPLFVRAVEKQ